jgi:putative methyltransferase (TIGR04325 family)
MANLSEDELQPTNSWLEAVRNSKGYENKSLVLDLIEQFKANLVNRLAINPISSLSQRQIHLLLAFLKIAHEGEVVSVGDFGGGNGYMCDFLRANNPNTKIKYDVYETSDIAEGYNNYSKELEIDFLDIKSFGERKYDLVLISCTLQYTNNWKEVLVTSSQIAKNILLMRLPLIDVDDHHVFIQHNYSGVYGLSHASWPIILFSKTLFLKEIKKLFDIVFELTDSEENYPFKGKNFPMNSFLLKSKESY